MAVVTVLVRASIVVLLVEREGLMLVKTMIRLRSMCDSWILMRRSVKSKGSYAMLLVYT